MGHGNIKNQCSFGTFVSWDRTHPRQNFEITIYMHIYGNMGFPGSSAGKEPTCNAGDLGSIPELGRSPGGGHGNPLQYSCLDNPHGQRSLVGCSPWGHSQESDMTEQLSTT